MADSRTQEVEDKYQEHLKNLAGRCPFCPETFNEDLNEVWLETDNWRCFVNAFKYEAAKVHFLIVPKRHIKVTEDMTASDWAEFSSLLTPLNTAHKDGLTFIRGGEHPGKSVEHLHWHFAVFPKGTAVKF